jgi:hypothetical protein
MMQVDSDKLSVIVCIGGMVGPPLAPASESHAVDHQ